MNIFVTKLSYDTSEETLAQLFEQFGSVDSVKIIFDRETGRSKGFGFVEMPDESEGRQAIEDLDGTELDGRTIIVKKAKPKEDNRGGGRGGFGGGGGRRW